MNAISRRNVSVSKSALCALAILAFTGHTSLFAADPEINADWDDAGSPELGTDYLVSTTSPASVDYPDVQLITGSLTWKVWSTDTDDPNDIGDIGHITSPYAQNFTVTIKDDEGGDGARDIKGINLDPASDSNHSNLTGSVSRDLKGDLFLQETTGGSGGTISFAIDGDVDGDLTIPKLAYLSISGTVASTCSINVGEVLEDASPIIFESYPDFAGDITVEDGLPSGTLMSIMGTLASTASIDFNSQPVAGGVELIGGAAGGSTISGGAVSSDV